MRPAWRGGCVGWAGWVGGFVTSTFVVLYIIAVVINTNIDSDTTHPPRILETVLYIKRLFQCLLNELNAIKRTIY